MLVVSSSPAAAMAAYPRGSILLLLPLCAACLCLVSPRATALSFSYNFSSPGDLNHADLKYINDSVRSSDRVDLTTRNKSNSTGRVFYTRPVRMWDNRTGETASFNTSFTFAMNGDPDRPSRGDGMAFFVGPFPASLPPGSGGAFLGLFADPRSRPSDASPQTVAVEFDTFRNTLWDPKEVAGDHMGIDVNSIISSNYTTSLGNGDLDGTMSATVVYDASSKLMVVTLQLANGSTHTVQASFDFKDGVGLPQEAAVGFSAATGASVQTNQILSWSFSSTDLASRTKIQVWVIILLSAAASALLAGLVVALLCVITRRQRPVPVEIALAEKVPRKFPYRELSTATNNFSEDRKLGNGCFGEVYRGDLRDPRMPPVAVKRLKRSTDPQIRRDYVTEIMTLGRLSHGNLVKLVGWCDGGGDKLLLVYELVTNKSLDDRLHGSPSEGLLTWPERYKIVIGIGKAIEYLHTGDKDAILHRDIKPSNVMLDGDFVAKLGDFGLVRQVKPGQSYLGGTVMIGTRVYMDPICISSDTVSTASDMYSFGVLLLEIAAGVKPKEVQGAGGHLSNTLVEAVRGSDARGAVLEMADARLEGKFDECQMERVLLVGLLCVQQNRKDRLGIREAVNLLSDLRHPLPQVVSSI